MSRRARSVTEVGPGDYVKIGNVWKPITTNTAWGDSLTPRTWTVTTEDGERYDMWSINAYAKREDIEAP